MSAIVKLHKDGDNMAISTDAQSEQEFMDALIPALADALLKFVAVEDDGVTFDPGKQLSSDMEFQLDRWIPQIIDLACKMRGYKADVHEHRVLVAGHWLPDELVTTFAPVRKSEPLAFQSAEAMAKG